MELIQEALSHEYADTFLVVFGVLFTVIGFVQVVRKSFALVLWLMLFAIGVFALAYVFKGSDIDFLKDTVNSVTQAGGLMPGIGDDVLRLMCEKLDSSL